MVLTVDMRADPDPDVRCHIEVSRIRIWRVLIDRRRPVNGDAAQNKAKKKWDVQPVAAAQQNMVPFNYEHPRLYQGRARSIRFMMRECQRVHALKLQLHGLVGRRNELKDLVRYKRSVRKLLRRRVNDIAGGKSNLLGSD